MSQLDLFCEDVDEGAKAVEKAPVFHPDLIVLDLAMRIMNGLQAARILRQMLPSVPIILFTLYAGSLREGQAREAGITSIVSKSEAASTLLNQPKTLLDS